MNLAYHWKVLSSVGMTPQSLAPISGHVNVFRVRLQEVPLIWKIASPREGAMHSAIASVLNEVTPTLLIPPVALEDGCVGLLMEDIGDSILSHANLPGFYGDAAAKLALVHRHFEGEPLPGAGKLARDFGNTFNEIPILLRVLERCIGSVVGDPQIEEIERIGAHGPGFLSEALSAGHSTLVHGDFHPGNIVRGASGIQIIDWGSAVAAPAEWDLVMCGEEQIQRYLEIRKPDRFLLRLRASIVVRMFEFIRAAVGLVLGESEISDEVLLMSIADYAQRLIEAANMMNHEATVSKAIPVSNMEVGGAPRPKCSF